MDTMLGPLTLRLSGRIIKPMRRLAKRMGLSSRGSRQAAIAWVPTVVARRYYEWSDRLGRGYTAPRERAACPACGSGALEQLQPLPLHGAIDGQFTGFVSGCRGCGTVFANPMPAPQTLERLYSPDGDWGRPRQEGAREKIPPVQYFIDLFVPLRDRFDVTAPPPGSAALDFGCGSGELLNVLQDLGWTTYGIEPAEKSAFRRHQELKSIPGTQMFDLAILHHVLEHVTDPLEILRAIHRCLKPGAILLVSVPRLDALPEHKDFYYCINDRTHVLAYTRDAMSALLGMAGFECVDAAGSIAGSTHWRDLKRLRMLGRKTERVAAPAIDPLESARRVFRLWRDGERAAGRLHASSASVRAQAAFAEFRRQRERSERASGAGRAGRASGVSGAGGASKAGRGDDAEN
jgi:SAM-dependent methyltransferase